MLFCFPLLMVVALLVFDLQNTTEPPAVVETLADVPEHVLRGLPEDVRLFPSAVDKTRLGECHNCKKRTKAFKMAHVNCLLQML